ncbi:hypothetical protein ARAM_000780 [Aspergillus rambellii]|uniref:Fido domain-containing protein n=1 Tax=Aspergillus rambellii TaxID=308745 RepID=A0A0F8WSU7_9EURO|nr:hypothetical protein ARAM_000780 [Aspergillus rambellii]
MAAQEYPLPECEPSPTFTWSLDEPNRLADGNKRTALLAADMFLNINGYRLQNVPFADDPFNKAALADAHVGRPSSSEISTSHFAKPLEQFTP